MTYEKRYGINNMREFINAESHWYFLSHRYGFRKENPLICANRDYIWDAKAGIILYGLEDLIGEDSLNAALREFSAKWAFRNHPPYAGGNDLYKTIQKYVPDSLKYYLTDSWEKITVYDNKILEATALPLGKTDSFRVHIKFSAGKIYSDSAGKEQRAVQMNDLIEIGVFATGSHPLYLKKQWLSSGEHTMDIMVKGKPAYVGIDPYGKLIDGQSADNFKNF
jgi:ABC-2 type transport system permease protein